jgi:ribonucleoside-diphosphate reductase alpha chain
MLESKHSGEKLTSIEVHDIVCHIADAVLSGGIRRSAIISLFDKDDNIMLNCKGNFNVEIVNGGFHYNPNTKTYEGEVFYKNKAHFISLSEYGFTDFSKNKSLPWYYFEPQRARANNSVVLKRDETSEDEFRTLFQKTKQSGAGEPGFFWTNDYDIVCNPCGEISLSSNSFCNLTEINVSTIKNQKDLLDRVEAATIIGTLQATYTDFHYLSKEWQENTEKDALLGVSLTGIADIDYTKFNWSEAANYAKLINEECAKNFGINSASRITTVKPSGTGSLALGTASGIHSRYAPFYKRNIRYNKSEAIAQYLSTNHPDIVSDELGNTTNIVVTLPVKSPKTSSFRNESALDFLARIKYFSDTWINHGHITGKNKHNISCTVNIREDEWDQVADWMWENRECYNGISVLPYDNGTYKQAPFEEITEKEFNSMERNMKSFDFTKVIEYDDRTELKGEVACSGGACEII